ncbi:MAG TPA: CarD family transcriptional regulator [Alphaproteobacteria bacterium]|nr:CarD family transcriptional regulator [Alphaproteobacteria bacterium]
MTKSKPVARVVKATKVARVAKAAKPAPRTKSAKSEPKLVKPVAHAAHVAHASHAAHPVHAAPRAAAPALKAAAKAASAKVVPVTKSPAAKPAKPEKIDFHNGDYVVYPTHGVGKIASIEKQSVAGMDLELIVIRFEKEKMTLRVPIEKAKVAGLRKLSSHQQMDIALATLKGRSRVSRAMWSRRAQEYEAKINSGDPVSIAEVVRDLHRNAGQSDQSYSERQIYEAALERLARELAAVERIERDAAAQKLEQVLKAA